MGADLGLPWKQGEHGTVFDRDKHVVEANGFASVLSFGDRMQRAKDRAAFIVRACNSHDELVEALTDIVDMIENCSGVPTNPDSLPQMVKEHARLALAKASATGREG